MGGELLTMIGAEVAAIGQESLGEEENVTEAM